jgi:two-component system phosphate regulon sensor histidine kinase PhoR
MAISDDADTELPEPSLKTTGGARLHAARYPLLVTLAVLLLASVIWPVPLTFALAGFAAIAFTTALVGGRPVAGRTERAGRSEVTRWPDTSIKSVIDAFRSPSFILDTGGVVRFANDAAREQFPDTRPGDLITLTFRSPQLSDALREAAAGRVAQVQYRERGEGARNFKVDVDPVTRPGLKTGFVLVTLFDVSEQLALARMRADFVANASHELRTPLTSLTGFVETLLGPARNDPEATENFLKIMLEQAERMRRLIDDLLSLSRLEMRAHHQPTEIVDLVPILRHVCDALAPVAAENGIVVNADLPEQPVFIRGDADEITQVFENLIENGLKYGKTGGKLDIAVDLTGGDVAPSVAIKVRDYGPGIAEEHLPRLTERFYRVDVESSRQNKGTGLGLAIVKHILAHHRGRLLIQSRPGEGATFTVELPIAERPAVDEKINNIK